MYNKEEQANITNPIHLKLLILIQKPGLDIHYQ